MLLINLLLIIEKLFLLKDEGIECEAQIKQLLLETQPSIEIIQFISNNIELNIRKFYEKLRKSYNDKKSKLYINIVKETELEPKEVLCTLGSLQLQILLFNKNIDDNNFLKNARFDDISKCMLNYYTTKDIIPCQRLLSYIKSDLKVLEEINK